MQCPIAAFVDDGLRFAARRSQSRIFWRLQSAVTLTAASDAQMNLTGREWSTAFKEAALGVAPR